MEDRERVRQASPLVEVLRAYLKLEKAGAGFRALCPFHREKSPSFHVNPQRGIYHCFGCQAGGDVFSFVMAIERCEFDEALERLAQRANLTLSPKRGAGASGPPQSSLQAANQAAQAWF